MAADGRVLYRSRLCVTASLSVWICLFCVLQPGVTVKQLGVALLPTGVRDSVEVAGCRFPVDFDDWLVVIHDHQKKVGHLRRLPPGYYLSLCSLFRYFQKGKINIFAQYLCLIYAQENARESLQFIKWQAFWGTFDLGVLLIWVIYMFSCFYF